ncbi:hypothetical protein BGY98DRAFT_39452 [Russula aff. rugulosa BPL654]|nr:hypothetical protein BGY98DRAFT_39452 [Russula aff. rugulosa BPL654]
MAAALAREPRPGQNKNKSSQSRLKSSHCQPYSTALTTESTSHPIDETARSNRSVSSRRSQYTCQMSPNTFHLGPSRCTRASFELLPPPSNLIQHTSFVAQHRVTLPALSLTTGPLLDSLPGARIMIQTEFAALPYGLNRARFVGPETKKTVRLLSHYR